MRDRNGCFGIVAYLLLFSLLVNSVNADLIGLWRFDEGDGNDVNDSSAYGHHGHLYASNTHKGRSGGVEVNNTVPRWITHTDYNFALEFGTLPGGGNPDSDNTNWNYVWVDQSETLANLGATWTIAFWVKQYVNNPDLLTSLPDPCGLGYQRVISCPHFEYELGIPSDMQDYFWPYYESGGTAYFQTGIGTTKSTGFWYHVALVYDGTDLKKYYNGALEDTKNISGQFLPDSFAPGEYLRFGAQTYPIKDYFIGALDDVAVFNQALSNDEVNKIRDGNFAGPWVEPEYESDAPTTFIWDSSFIAQKDNIVLDFGQKKKGGTGIPSYNWQMEGTVNEPNWYGLVNAGLLDGDALTIEYAAYTTLEDNIVQPKTGDYAIHRRIHKDTKYDLKARFAGENTSNNYIGIKFYAVDVNENPDTKVLLADLKELITVNQTWHEVSTTFTADEVNYPDTNMTFLAECYIEKNGPGGNGRGDAFAWFDYVRIDVNEFYTCDALYYYYGNNPDLPYDLIEDCRMDFKDYAVLAGSNGNNTEPSIEVGELLVNSDLYQDIDKVPNNGDFVIDAPTGWSFVPAPDQNDDAGIWNRDRNGLAGFSWYQPAGGSVAAYIDKDVNLVQVAPTPIEEGKTYYVSAMVGGNPDGNELSTYLSMAQLTLEYVDNPNTQTNPVKVTDVNFVLPRSLVWRAITTEYTADVSADGKYLRLTYDLTSTPLTEPNGLGMLGKASISNTKPSVWPRQNLLPNGDFEDYSSLPAGTPGDKEGWVNLFDYEGTWTEDAIPDWYTSGPPDSGLYGLQCMLWVGPPQPAQGRIAAWFDCDDYIAQKGNEPIALGTYYVDFIACINSGGYPAGTKSWPAGDDPNLVVEVFWTNEDDLSGTENVDWGHILTLKESVTGPIEGYTGSPPVPFGYWATPSDSFEITNPSIVDANFYVKAYCDVAAADYATFEEIYLSKEPRLEIGAYTCYEQRNKYGSTVEADLNDDCDVDLEDLALLVGDWLECNDPEGCD